MKKETRRMARLRLDERLRPLKPEDRFKAPPKGWTRAIRDALGMTGKQLAKRLNVSPQNIDALEKSEAKGTIKIETLRRAAEAVDCTLVYAFVPKTSLQATLQDRARKIALRELGRVAHTMELEAQGTGDDGLEKRIDSYIRDTIKDRDLWAQY